MTASMPSIEVGTIGGGTNLGLLGCPRDARHQGCPLHFSQPGCPTPHLHYHYFRHGGWAITSQCSCYQTPHVHASYAQPLAGWHINVIAACYPWSHCQQYRLGANDGQKKSRTSTWTCSLTFIINNISMATKSILQRILYMANASTDPSWTTLLRQKVSFRIISMKFVVQPLLLLPTSQWSQFLALASKFSPICSCHSHSRTLSSKFQHQCFTFFIVWRILSAS